MRINEKVIIGIILALLIGNVFGWSLWIVSRGNSERQLEIIRGLETRNKDLKLSVRQFDIERERIKTITDGLEESIISADSRYTEILDSSGSDLKQAKNTAERIEQGIKRLEEQFKNIMDLASEYRRICRSFVDLDN